MRENIKDLLRDVNSKIEKTYECEWDIIRDMFAESIKRKGLSQEEVNEMSERMLKGVREENKVRYGIVNR